ncbi:hypothetical protein M405DRAFT_821022 [Rhizopogon salebrosus TDB-379]|nr:hypothetical protein M405DRAFT_821022 [Rhizopogon salebrosus TDB-379]
MLEGQDTGLCTLTWHPRNASLPSRAGILVELLRVRDEELTILCRDSVENGAATTSEDLKDD